MGTRYWVLGIVHAAHSTPAAMVEVFPHTLTTPANFQGWQGYKLHTASFLPKATPDPSPPRPDCDLPAWDFWDADAPAARAHAELSDEHAQAGGICDIWAIEIGRDGHFDSGLGEGWGMRLHRPPEAELRTGPVDMETSTQPRKPPQLPSCVSRVENVYFTTDNCTGVRASTPLMRSVRIFLSTLERGCDGRLILQQPLLLGRQKKEASISQLCNNPQA